MNDTRRRDALPIWVIVLLLVFLALRIFDISTLPRGQSAQAEQTASDTSMADLIETDQLAKAAYAVTLTQQGSVLRPDPARLRAALAAADSYQTSARNSPSSARRVIILRALLMAADTPAAAAKDVAPLAIGPNHLAPLAAFTTALPTDTLPVDRTIEAREGSIWKTAFSDPPPKRLQALQLARQIDRLPEIRWWRWPALTALYEGQGNTAMANREASDAGHAAAPPLLGMSLLTLLRVALGLFGLAALIYFFVRFVVLQSGEKTAEPAPNLWPTVPERQPFSERLLGAGDLMAVFVVYLLSRVAVEWILGGFPGFGREHRLGVPGLLTPYDGQIRQMPSAERNSVNVVVDAFAYLLSAVPPIIYLIVMARRRGASLARELGWTTRSLGPNVMFGIAGYGIATPLILLVGFLGPSLLRHAPAPSNPVIPEMVNTSGVWVTVTLVLLASVAAPLVEELLFRGVFYNAAKLRLGPWPAIVLTGLVFGFVHPVGIAEMLVIAVLGGVFAWMAETRKSLVPSITAHCVNNLFSTLFLLLAIAR